MVRVVSEFRGMSLRTQDGGGSFTTVEREGWWMSEAKFEMTKKGLVTGKLWEGRFKSRELWPGKAKGSREGCLKEYGKGGKGESWCFELEQVGDRRVVDEGEGRCMAVMGVKTVVVAKETCLPSERSVRQVEDGGGGRRGAGGVLWSRRTGRECVTHCP